ncbi:MAG: ABC transporter substrate-binding protein [Dehalococcoidia bacterium]|nr:ABC transporter substrate-binding protein [Dehalococcoidia bacterium]MCA9856251.1 ABC transporter substrate-binding protein [Dehalococcoidia bacterium]
MTRRYSRRRFLGFGASVVTGLGVAALTGCTADEGPGDSTPSASATETDDRIRVRIASSAVKPPSNPAELSVGVLDSEVGIDGLDPIARAATYSRLVGFDPRTASIYGDLASAVELPEPLVVHLRLRDGAFFHPDASGTASPVTAEVVKRDFEARRDEGTFLFTNVVDTVEATSAVDVVLRLKAPFSLLFEYLSRTDASIRSAQDYGGIRAPIGSGPFLPAGTNGDALVLRPNPLVPEAEKPRVSQLRVRRVAQPADLDALFIQREIDVREHPDDRSREVAGRREDRVELSRPRQRMRGLALSLLAPRDQASATVVEAFRDSRVRRAISIALDRQALLAVDGGLLSGPVGPSFAGDALPPVELEAHPLYQRSLGEAAKLIDAAGHTGIELRLSHSDSPLMLSLAQQVADQLLEAGIGVRLAGRPQQEFETSFLAGDFEAAFFELDRLGSPDIGLRLHTSGGLEGDRSPWGYSNPVYDAKVREALSQIDPGERTRHSREAQRMLLDDVPAMLPLTAPLEYASIREGVTGYEFDAYEFNAGTLARFWQGPEAAEAANPEA